LRIGKGYFIVVHPLQLAKVIAQVSIDKLRIAMRRLSVDFVLRINGSCIFDLRLFSCPFGRGHHDNIDMARLAVISSQIGRKSLKISNSGCLALIVWFLLSSRAVKPHLVSAVKQGCQATSGFCCQAGLSSRIIITGSLAPLSSGKFIWGTGF
jgi:hypothetical protein